MRTRVDEGPMTSRGRVGGQPLSRPCRPARV